MVNKVILIGNVGNDPEVKYVKENVPVARFRLATGETYKNQNGERITNTEWHNIVVWRGLATVVEKYVKKGSKLYIEGKLTHRKYEDKEGQTKYYTEIVCRDMTMLDSKGSSEQSENKENSTSANIQEPPADFNDVEDFNDVDDLPF